MKKILIPREGNATFTMICANTGSRKEPTGELARESTRKVIERDTELGADKEEKRMYPERLYVCINNSWSQECLRDFVQHRIPRFNGGNDDHEKDKKSQGIQEGLPSRV